MFKRSTHYNNWKFTKKEIREIRNEANIKVVQLLTSEYEGVMNREFKLEIVPKLDEMQLMKHYVAKKVLSPLCAALKLTRNAEYTALTYYHRFFLKHSIVQYDVNSIALAAIFVTVKTEGLRLKLNTIVDTLKKISDTSIKHDQILRAEVILIQGMDFDFRVYQPYRILHVFIKDLEINDANDRKTCIQLLDKLKYTDAVLVYSPGKIALAVIYYVLKNKGQEDQIVKITKDSHLHLESVFEYLQGDDHINDEEFIANVFSKARKIRRFFKKLEKRKEKELKRLLEEEEEERKLKHQQEQEASDAKFLASGEMHKNNLFYNE